LPQPISEGETSKIELDWEAQIPEQIRRSGRNSKENIALSMAQWYPKMAHFDEFGWHLDEYVVREFVAAVGNVDGEIDIAEGDVLVGSGVRHNPHSVKGYQKNPVIKAQNGTVK